MSNIYAGVGSRETPQDVLERIDVIAKFLAGRGWRLRSGGAPGADTAFEKGTLAVFARPSPEIYLPWRQFNGHASSRYGVTEAALALAQRIHPAWNMLSVSVRRLLARNCYQVLGADLKTPVNCVVCWTPGGGSVGGSAIELARLYHIPVITLFGRPDVEAVIKEIEATGT